MRHLELIIFYATANSTRTQHEISGLELKGLICLIKCIMLEFTDKVLYSYFDTTQLEPDTRHLEYKLNMKLMD